METLDQRRRRMMAAKEDLDTERPSDPHREGEAALSQSSVGLNGSMDRPEPAVAGEGQLRPTSLCGSGSPDTMERGMMPVVPSPFHSERVRAEIELQRSRPATLDRDAALAASSEVTARIARVETTVGSGEVGVRATEESRTQSPRQPVSSVGWRGL